MIANGKKWYYAAVKKLSAFFKGIAPKHDGDFYCLNYFHSYSTRDRLKKHENVCKDHFVEMPNKDNITLKYNHS